MDCHLDVYPDSLYSKLGREFLIKTFLWYQKNPELEDVTGLTVGGQKTKYDFHKVIFDKKKLTNL